jgi:hypothetical protein
LPCSPPAAADAAPAAASALSTLNLSRCRHRRRGARHRGQLPYVGWLFRSLSRTRKKTNLVVFLRPRVLRDEAATDELSLDRYDYIRARQRELPLDVHKVLPENDAPELPPLGTRERGAEPVVVKPS